MLKSRIKEHALAREIELKFVKNIGELAILLQDKAAKRLIVDLSAGPEFASAFASILTPEIESFGVIAHVDLDTQKAAKEAGFSQVIPRSALVKNIAEIIC